MMTSKFRTAILCLVALAVVGCAKTTTGSRGGAPGSTAPSAAAGASVTGEVRVTLTEFTVTANQSSVPAGKHRFAITNSGQAQHELLVFRSDLASSALPMTDGDLNEEGAGVTKVSDGDNLDRGKSQTREVDLSQPGTYLLICNLPGHLHAGMISMLTVK